MLNPLPWAVWALVLPIAGVELVLSAGAHGLVNWPGSALWREGVMARLAVSPALQDWMLATGQVSLTHLARYAGFALVHHGPAQALLIVVILAALAKVAAEALGSGRVLVIVLLAQGLGAAAFGLTAPEGALLIGGHPLIFAAAGSYGAVMAQKGTDAATRLKGLKLVAALVVVRLILVVLTGSPADVLADLVACLMGYALARALRPGILRRLRRA